MLIFSNEINLNTTLMGFFNLFKKSTPGQSNQAPEQNVLSGNPIPESMPPDQVAAALEKLDYFKYADPAHLNQLKAEIGQGLAKDHYLPIVDSGRPNYKIIDPRHYHLDNEDLFEQGGMVTSLAEMSPLFSKMNIRMDITDHVEEVDDLSRLNHRITLNGKLYTLFHEWEDYGWGEAAQRFADMVNDQLILQNSSEQLYLIAGGNDGRAVFLTAEQYAFIRPSINGIQECPLPTKEWCDANGVTWENVTEQK